MMCHVLRTMNLAGRRAPSGHGQRIKSRFFPFGAPESFLMLRPVGSGREISLRWLLVTGCTPD